MKESAFDPTLAAFFDGLLVSDDNTMNATKSKTSAAGIVIANTTKAKKEMTKKNDAINDDENESDDDDDDDDSARGGGSNKPAWDFSRYAEDAREELKATHRTSIDEKIERKRKACDKNRRESDDT